MVDPIALGFLVVIIVCVVAGGIVGYVVVDEYRVLSTIIGVLCGLVAAGILAVLSYGIFRLYENAPKLEAAQHKKASGQNV